MPISETFVYVVVSEQSISLGANKPNELNKPSAREIHASDSGAYLTGPNSPTNPTNPTNQLTQQTHLGRQVQKWNN